jgi:transglutaminase-like putative cysteine protease
VSAAGHTIQVPARYERARTRESTEASLRRRTVTRTITFGALSAYGTERWATLMHHAPGWRLFGLFALAMALVTAVPLLRRAGTAGRIAGGVVAVGLMLAVFPVAGLRWHWVVHLKIAHGADRIGNGLQALPNVLVPYLGTSQAVRLVMVLGAAVLLLDAAAVLAFAGRDVGDGRRAAAALPLLALAVVPMTLVRPQLPYLQGLLLFGLLAAFMWGERLRRDAAATALTVAAVAGVAGALVAPRIDSRTPWINYRSWTGTLVNAHIDSFNWNQTYGPLRWPRSGHQVLTVHARSGDYWKAEDLDTFDGREWVVGDGVTDPEVLPQPSEVAQQRFSQKVTVSITGMRTLDVVGAGYTSLLAGLDGATAPGPDPGTLVARRVLGPGTIYTVASYSPHPTAEQLRTAGAAARYPDVPTAPYRTLAIPQQGLTPGLSTTEIEFPAWHSTAPYDRQLVHSSPYGRAYALAQRLAGRARTPYDFVTSVKRYLSRGYAYDERPPAAQFPLESFLFTHKEGYCQQFSGAMAMLLRMGGIPTRVAAGFTPGAFDNDNHSWLVADTDAHAWVEAWFPRYGWVRFDPTPTTAPARGGAAPAPILKPLTGVSGSDTTAAPRHEVGVANTATTGVRRGAGSGLSVWVILAGLVGLAAVTRLAWILLAPANSTEQLLAELRRAMARTGRPLSDDVTLAMLEKRFADSPAAVAYVRSLRLARYGAATEPPSGAQRRALRRQLAFGLGASGRVRALWALPPRLRRAAAPTPRASVPKGGQGSSTES